EYQRGRSRVLNLKSFMPQGGSRDDENGASAGLSFVRLFHARCRWLTASKSALGNCSAPVYSPRPLIAGRKQAGDLHRPTTVPDTRALLCAGVCGKTS